MENLLLLPFRRIFANSPQLRLFNFVIDIADLFLKSGPLYVLLFLSIGNSPEYEYPNDYLTIHGKVHCSLAAIGKLPRFDYIVIGAGTAGSVVAYRLTNQFPDRNVLLIDAGDNPSIVSVSPVLFPLGLKTSSNFFYYAEPANYSLGLKIGTSNVCGKGLGGSSSINAMQYVCGTDKNYNDWARITEDSSWNYKNILKFIKKHQNMRDSSLTEGKCAKYHGTDGPLSVSNLGYDADMLIPKLRNAAAELGYKELEDINCGPPYTGFVNIRMTSYNGQRESAARAFLVPLNRKNNFYLMKNSYVTNLIFENDERTNKPVLAGVKIKTDHSECRNIVVKASREVILSAGALTTPKILLQSGIGRREDLQPCGIHQNFDLPAGKDLSDHPIQVLFFKMSEKSNNFWSRLQSTAGLYGEAVKYTTFFNGYFSTTAGSSYQGFINTKDPNSTYPDIQLIFLRFPQFLIDFDAIMLNGFGFNPEISNQLIELNQNYAIIMLAVTLLNPTSRGSVSLSSCTDPLANPKIIGNYLKTREDHETMMRGIKAANDLLSTKEMKNAGVSPAGISIPECDPYEYNSDDYNRCVIKYTSQNLWHPTGTAKMGSLNDANAVVDSHLKLRGLTRGFNNNMPMLRVADASIMPLIISGNTQCPTYTIGEKAAQMIIDDNL